MASRPRYPVFVKFSLPISITSREPVLFARCNLQAELLQSGPQLPLHHPARDGFIVHCDAGSGVRFHQLQLADIARVPLDELDCVGLEAVLGEALQLRQHPLSSVACSYRRVERCGGQFVPVWDLSACEQFVRPGICERRGVRRQRALSGAARTRA